MTQLCVTQNPNPKVFVGQSRRLFWRVYKQIVGLVAITAGQLGPVEAIAVETASVVWLTGAKFRQELERPFSASWTFAEPRQILKDVESARRIAIVMDRRLDPSRHSSFDTKNVSLRTGLDEFAKTVSGHVSLPGNFVYLGPESATRRLRTLIELRKLELQSKEAGIPERRRSELQRPRKFEWNDLDPPREILGNFANPFRLTVTNDHLVPHDLWAAAALPDATVTEALSVVLIQFDLTFKWIDSGASIELLPIPERISVERKHHSKLKPAAAISLIRQKFPDLDAKASSSEIILNGLVEDHEAVSSLLRGEIPSHSAKLEQPLNIRQQLFTMSAEQPVPLIAVMKNLEESDIHFEYNADQLKAAGIDLEQTIQLNVKDMPALEFFKSIFGPARLDFQIDRQTVKLKPKKTASSNQ